MGGICRGWRRPKNQAGAGTAVIILLLGSFRHYGWPNAPGEIQGEVWKIGAGVCILGLCLRLWLLERGKILACVVAWMAFEELQVVICSAAYIVKPWPVPDGAAVCSAAAGFDLGSLGLMAVAFIAWRLSR